jgi:formate-dependent nitrite reductase membrane component NrfD
MATRDFPIVGDSLALGYRFQRHWNQSMANAFFCGELGAGVFLAAFLYGSVVGMIVGVLITAILKTYFHLSHMGVPERSWRAILRPDRSWISRGAISIVFFTGAAILYIVLGRLGLLGWLGLADGAFGQGLLWLVQLVAVVFAMVVMVYHGFAIADSSSIAFWNTGLMPVSSFSYSFFSGLVVTMNLDPRAGAEAVGMMPPIHSAALIALVLTIIVLAAMLQAANRGAPGARKSLGLLLREGPYVKAFYGLVVLAGLVLPFVLLFAPSSRISDVLILVGVLAGYYTFRSLVFKVGLYDPIISFAPES